MKNEQNPASIPFRQRVTREFIRDVGHFVAFRAENKNIVPDGLSRAQEFLDQGIGVVVVEHHFAGIDPLWTANGMTRKWRHRALPVSGPIRIDRTPKGLVKIAGTAGFKLQTIMTPDALSDINANVSRAERKELVQEVRKLRDRYEDESSRTIKKGGVVIVAQGAHRNPQVPEPGQVGVVSNLVYALRERGVDQFGIHFATCEIPGETDYKKRRGYNIGSKYIVRHGATLTASELLAMAEPSSPDLTTKAKSDRTKAEIDRISYNELLRIVPRAQLPSSL